MQNYLRTFRTCVLCCILSHSYTLVFWDFFSETCCIVSVISIYIIYYCSILHRFEHKKSHFSCKKALYCTINKKYVLNSKRFSKNSEWFWLSMMCTFSIVIFIKIAYQLCILALLKIKRKIEYLLNRLRYCKNF